MCCDFTEGECGHMSKRCIIKEYEHLPEMAAREFCGCASCKRIYKTMIEEHNERAARLRYNNGKYIPEWRLLGK